MCCCSPPASGRTAGGPSGCRLWVVCCLWVRLRPPEQAPLALNKTDILLTCPGPATAVGACCCGRVVVFGDGKNDVDMLTHAGFGVAMGNACEEAKAAADYVTDDVDENGIFNALRHFNVI